MYQLCRHIMPNGNRCHAPAVLGAYFCYFHKRLHCKADEHSSKFEESVAIPILEDRCAIQVAVSNVLNALGSSKLDVRKAGVFLYGLQIASQNVERKNFIISYDTVESVTNENGDDLAPPEHKCNDEDDCDTCPFSDTCERRVDIDEEQEDDNDE
jgi:hypothetical protein